MASSPQNFSDDLQSFAQTNSRLVCKQNNNKLSLYVSPVPDTKAMAVDALNISWEALDSYAYCPTALIPKQIQIRPKGVLVS